MISITRLLCGTIGPGDHLRYTGSAQQRPIVVWNCTRQCNLKCRHCYASADNHRSPGEMTTAEGKRFIDDLAEYGVPVILFSGGEPLMRQDLIELATYAKQQGLRVAMSTNGTLITPEIATKLKAIGFGEVGISLDGIGANNDTFRGKDGAFDAALAGIRNCVKEDIRVSLRLTITRWNYREIPAIFQLVEDENVHRVCFYHLAYSGRGTELIEADISHAQCREVVDDICQRTVDLHRRGETKEILTVGNHADGVYLYLKELERDPARAEEMLALLRLNGGNNSGIKIAAVDDIGYVHPDQFWWHCKMGNVRERKFADIWTDLSNPVTAGLKDRQGLLKGRCAKCVHLAICNGNLRVRAEAVHGDIWASDPACYLSDAETAGQTLDSSAPVLNA